MVLTRRGMRSSTNAYLTALAITDLVYLLCVFWLSLRHYPHMKTDLTLANFYAYTWPYSLWLTDATSKYHITAPPSFPILSSTICSTERFFFFYCVLYSLRFKGLFRMTVWYTGMEYVCWFAHPEVSLLIKQESLVDDDHDDLSGWSLFVEKSMTSFPIYSLMMIKRFLLYFRCTR